jgi:hypothetical protein
MLNKIFFSLFFLTQLFLIKEGVSKTIEIPYIDAILNEIDHDTLVLFDIDATTLTTTSTLGTHAWWTYFLEKMSVTHEKRTQIQKELCPIIDKILKSAHITTVESHTAFLIQSLQESGITVIALTGRPQFAPWDQKFGEYTRDQLAHVNIDFRKSKWPKKIQFDSNFSSENYAHGIIFSNHQPKGPVLVKFLKDIDYYPKKIVMVDDCSDFIDSIESALEEEKIPFVGFHYRHIDQFSAALDPFIGNIQLRELLLHDRYISDEEAASMKKVLLKQDPKLTPDFFVDQLIENLLSTSTR